MLLVIGDGFVFHMAAHLDRRWRVSCACRLGARLAGESFRDWAIRTAREHRCGRVLLIIGGNDLARPDFRLRQFMEQLRELELGLLAAGATAISIMAIPPRVGRRAGDAASAVYRQRRKLTNLTMRLRYQRPPAQFVAIPAGPVSRFLGRDGVHPSRGGWLVLCQVVLALCYH